MPLIAVQTSQRLTDSAKDELCKELSRLCAVAIGKPETYVMVSVSEGVSMLFAGRGGPAAFIDVRSIGGLSPAVNGTLSERICALLKRLAVISPDRVYLNFTDVAATHWGHDGTTFG